jgi:hypothetical protein
VGNLSIKITATDPSNASVSTTFSLIVVNVNDAPEVATPVPAQTAVEGSALISLSRRVPSAIRMAIL